MINTELINKILGKAISKAISFDLLASVDSDRPNTLTYCTNEKYLSKALSNPNVKGIICHQSLTKEILVNKDIIESDKPGYDFILLHNHVERNRNNLKKSIINNSANIHPTAVISEFGVLIEEGVTIGPYVVVYPNVTIKSNTCIGAHSVLGCDDVEAKRSDLGFINAFHDGGLEVGSSCFVGSGVIIGRGVYGKTTLIGGNTFFSNNSFIAHNVTIGENCLILGAHICGSVEIGSNVTINPKALISNGIKIGNNASILLGSVVISNVQNNKTVSGHYAIEHPRYLYKFVKLFGKI